MFTANCIWHTEYRVIKIYSNKNTQNVLNFCPGITKDWFTFTGSQSDVFSIQITTWRKVQHFKVNSKISGFYHNAIYNPINIFTLLSNTHCQSTVWKTTAKTEKYKQHVHCTNTSIVYTLQSAVQMIYCSVTERLPKLWQWWVQTQGRKREREKKPIKIRTSSMSLKAKKQAS